MTKKKCHLCFKYKPLDQYNTVYIADDEWYEVNYCLDCEAMRPKKKHVSPPINTYEDTRYYCAYIGNTSYKEICRIYKIRYEEPE